MSMSYTSVRISFWGFSFYPLSIFFILLGMWLCVGNSIFIVEWVVFKSGGVVISYLFLVDWLGAIFAGVVSVITGSVLIFTSWYMADELFKSRFVRLIGLFVLSMNLLLFSCSMVGLMLGWDGLGLVSFILVMYYRNRKSLGAAMITALTNRLGDAMLLVGIGFCLSQGHWCVSEMWVGCGISVGVLIILAACTKSAQMPFCSWLPLAMAAPTPISALVHSSTLVTAGIFILIRFHDFLSSSELLMSSLMLVSSLTMMMASGAACVECDLKKVVALSTLSHLGLMGLSLGLGCWWFSFFHLVVHALTKALLFICVGVLIHDFGHFQDMRMMGGLAYARPISVVVMLVTMAGLSGIPFLAGYYSKHVIFSGLLAGSVNHYLAFASMFVVLATGFYSVRVMWMVYFSPLVGSPMVLSPSESNYMILVPFLVLGVGAVVWGLVMMWWMVPLVNGVVSWYYEYLPLVLLFIGGVLGKMAVVVERRKPFVFCNIGNFLHNMWYLKSLSMQPFISPSGEMGGDYYDDLDHGWTETVSSQGMGELVEDCYWLVRGDLDMVSPSRLQYGVSFYSFFLLLFRF